MRAYLPLLLLLLLATAGSAVAGEEVFVLENGTVFRGSVVQGDERQLEVKLSGFGRAATVSRLSGGAHTKLMDSCDL